MSGTGAQHIIPDAGVPTYPVPLIYTDGGMLGQNPTRLAISWGWCRVESDQIVRHESGWIRASELPPRMETGIPEGTTNQAEFYAVLMALEALGDGEGADFFLDSEVTRQRMMGNGGYHSIPALWRVRLNRAMLRVGRLTWTHIAGHPSTVKKGADGLTDLERGRNSKGYPVSRFNVFVDGLCSQAAALAQLTLESENDTGQKLSGGYIVAT